MIDKNCKYYPCHSKVEDCSFCYCPIYPCKNKKRGKWTKEIWDCSDCTIIHDKKTVELCKIQIEYFIKINEK